MHENINAAMHVELFCVAYRMLGFLDNLLRKHLRCQVKLRSKLNNSTIRTISLFVWLWLVVNDHKFPAGTIFFSHTN